ncbi:MAG TPA: tRNA (adenosine(37)-N6)-dimethylallyltransferase MiaA [Thermoleophilaceae bacterium]|nr:tRNA (adenosine(37)-N6)-dimethylallyltransferase MiaA [Thermoleophilaceae bacterium]
MIAIFGPTGVGKTAVAVALADALRARGEDPVAISADALQLYQGLEVLTGAPTPEERARLEHRLLGSVPVTDAFSVGEFMPRAHAEIDAALTTGRRPIVVGGTGLYLRAALTELDLAPPPDPGVRERLEAELRRRGVEALHAELERRAPEIAERIAPTDRARVLRALEHPTGGNREEGSAEEPSQLWSGDVRHPTFLAGLTMRRARLYERIDARVDGMVAAGAVEEVHRAESCGASRTARKALGYQELLEGDVEAMKRRTRNYAKRQLTWMRKLPGVATVDLTHASPREAAREIARRAVREATV